VVAGDCEISSALPETLALCANQHPSAMSFEIIRKTWSPWVKRPLTRCLASGRPPGSIEKAIDELAEGPTKTELPYRSDPDPTLRLGETSAVVTYAIRTKLCRPGDGVVCCGQPQLRCAWFSRKLQGCLRCYPRRVRRMKLLCAVRSGLRAVTLGRNTQACCGRRLWRVSNNTVSWVMPSLVVRQRLAGMPQA
jgi:hypothetical protein